MTKWMNRGLALATMMIAACFIAGCDDGDGGGGGGGSNAFVGTWLIQKEATEAYWIFFADGTFRKNLADEPIDGAVHFYGTYTVSGGTLSGDFTNPGIGAGEIECTIAADGTMAMDFIEYWHTPPKHIACTGVRQ